MDPWVYQYTIGGAVFAIGLVYAARQGYVGWTGRGLRRLAVLVFALLAFAGGQAYLQYAPMSTAQPVAFDGSFTRKPVLGTPLDYAVMVGYFLAILAVGTWFGRHQKTTRDFFFGGQRFSWWLIAFSLVATTVGSYSFVKYSQAGFEFGVSSTQSYLNDIFWMPLLIFGWLPILYFSRVTSIPEYFERRFDRTVRAWATGILLVYLVSYVGVNLFTMGTALNALLGWDIVLAAALVATISMIYVSSGGQTSVIMTDLFQGVMLLATGLILFVLGIATLGGFDGFWEHLPRPHRSAFSHFNADPSFPAVGIFWQDAMANSCFFYFLNQGMIMRYLAAKSVAEARKAALFMPLVLMPVAAVVVSCGGWIARSMVHAGILPPDLAAKDAFFVAAELISRPGLFGLIMAALTAALMSTVDTLITAVSAVAVNDVYRPYIRPQASERQLLRVARICAVGVTLLGIALVPVFAGFESIYAAHGAMTAAVTPPLVVTLLASVFWKRFTRTAALATLIGGVAAIVASIAFPQLIAPFAHGVEAVETGGGVFAGLKQYKFMRGFYGLVVSAAIAVTVTLFTRPERTERTRGLVWGTVADALRRYKGAPGLDRPPIRGTARLEPLSDASGDDPSQHEWPVVDVSPGLAQALAIEPEALLYLSDRRAWLGGLKSRHAKVRAIRGVCDESIVFAGGDLRALLAARPDRIAVERLY